ncbi:MAG: hypothetical protein KDB80_06090, partial [Planctomycetes bacterium]|nr:hypothetical protein [Planctomycetota bacterium]
MLRLAHVGIAFLPFLADLPAQEGGGDLGARLAVLESEWKKAPDDVDLAHAGFLLSLRIGDEERLTEFGLALLEMLDKSALRATVSSILASMSEEDSDLDYVGRLSSPVLVKQFYAFAEAGHMRGMHRVVEAFEQRDVEDPAVLFVVGEFYGSDNEHFDKDRAMSAFESFIAKSEPGDADCMSALLRELFGSPTSRIEELRKTVVKYITDLARDERLKRAVSTTRRKLGDRPPESEFQIRFERLALFRAKKRYDEYGDVLGELLRLAPDHPVLKFAEGEFYGSFGARFDSERAIGAFEVFLRATTDEEFEKPGTTGRGYEESDMLTLAHS